MLSRVYTDTESGHLHDYITKDLRIDLPKSFCKKRGDDILLWNRIPSFQGSADDEILIHFVDILLKVCDPDDRHDKKHFYDSLEVLEKFIDW